MYNAKSSRKNVMEFVTSPTVTLADDVKKNLTSLAHEPTPGHLDATNTHPGCEKFFNSIMISGIK